jgi:hypothetical protein
MDGGEYFVQVFKKVQEEKMEYEQEGGQKKLEWKNK